LDKDDLSTLLTQSAAGETVAIEEDRLRSIFGHGMHALDERTRREAAQFAEEHNCDLVFDRASRRRASFTKREHPPSAHTKTF
jgi:hypothetical protein